MKNDLQNSDLVKSEQKMQCLVDESLSDNRYPISILITDTVTLLTYF